MARPPLLTRNGRRFDEVASLLQKALRRGDVVLAARAVTELLPRYASYCWRRLMIVSAEDCADLVTTEVVALYDAWHHVTGGKFNPQRPNYGMVFLMKAVVLLAKCRHSRDADELLLLVANRLPDADFDAALAQCEAVAVADDDFEIPAYVLDVHTQRGRKRGKTRAGFIRTEHDALADASSIFANFDEMAATTSYVQPELFWDQ